jgi:hypothetical protein
VCDHILILVGNDITYRKREVLEKNPALEKKPNWCDRKQKTSHHILIPFGHVKMVKEKKGKGEGKKREKRLSSPET